MAKSGSPLLLELFPVNYANVHPDKQSGECMNKNGAPDSFLVYESRLVPTDLISID